MQVGMVNGMTIQITVRLPDEQVQYIDAQVAAGKATSRAAAIARALRNAEDEDDLRKIEAAGPDPDLDGLVEWAADNQAYPDVE
jgi:Arc/MetJ-type ribon-helix-helix transcriptional regulator